MSMTIAGLRTCERPTAWLMVRPMGRSAPGTFRGSALLGKKRFVRQKEVEAKDGAALEGIYWECFAANRRNIFFRFELGIVRRLRAGAVLACYLVTLTSRKEELRLLAARLMRPSFRCTLGERD
jgi:hypothetical protein